MNTLTRSTVKFPYTDLEAAVQVAEVVHSHGGECADVPLAAGLGVTSSSGFRARRASANLFGLTWRCSHEPLTLLTGLGGRAVDPEQAAAAKADAFLRVPLYSAVYDRFEGQPLPAGRELDDALVDLGVVPKTAARARRVMLRSAEAAGFFGEAADRLVKPVFPDAVSAAPPENADREADPLGPQPPGREPKLDPLLQTLWAGLSTKLPPPEDGFPAAMRIRWLLMFELAFDMVYGPCDTPAAEPPGGGAQHAQDAASNGARRQKTRQSSQLADTPSSRRRDPTLIRGNGATNTPAFAERDRLGPNP